MISPFMFVNGESFRLIDSRSFFLSKTRFRPLPSIFYYRCGSPIFNWLPLKSGLNSTNFCAAIHWMEFRFWHSKLGDLFSIGTFSVYLVEILFSYIISKSSSELLNCRIYFNFSLFFLEVFLKEDVFLSKSFFGEFSDIGIKQFPTVGLNFSNYYIFYFFRGDING